MEQGRALGSAAGTEQPRRRSWRQGNSGRAALSHVHAHRTLGCRHPLVVAAASRYCCSRELCALLVSAHQDDGGCLAAAGHTIVCEGL